MLSKKLQFAVDFANFARQHNDMSAVDLANLCQIVENRAALAVKGCNEPLTDQEDKEEDRLIEEACKLGTKMGFEITFDAIYPTLHRNGQTFCLPLDHF